MSGGPASDLLQREEETPLRLIGVSNHAQSGVAAGESHIVCLPIVTTVIARRLTWAGQPGLSSLL
ncbi:hypothetical protein P171DRAFT_230796 [Karstenula rhodostoma CBS 690.94]|uniref:Uncharacterized protein n=1 Tax=Karstenula rhodostoma CBS 690.94 TaxID=1392251 RepID=A0A9P4UFY7_9PLEO|nr:hypothetical protein P171DRAFT_230796 [Karstenula rhodostoma CBS 690.94]